MEQRIILALLTTLNYEHGHVEHNQPIHNNHIFKLFKKEQASSDDGGGDGGGEEDGSDYEKSRQKLIGKR